VKFYLVIDFETSGLIQDGGQPVELGAVLLDRKDLTPVAEFQAFVLYDPERFTWSPDAEEVHGITVEALAEVGVTMDEAFTAFLDWLVGFVDLEARGEVMLCGQNLLFDLRFLQLMAGVGPMEDLLPPWACYTTRDTLQWAALLNQAHIDAFGFRSAPFRDPETGNPSLALENLASSLGFTFPGAHSALEDARMAGKILKRLLELLAGDLSNSRKYLARRAHIDGRKSPVKTG